MGLAELSTPNTDTNLAAAMGQGQQSVPQQAPVPQQPGGVPGADPMSIIAQLLQQGVQRQQNAPNMKQPKQLDMPAPYQQHAGERNQTAAAVLNGALRGFTSIYNKHEQEKSEATQADLKIAMQTHATNEQLKTMLDDSQAPPEKKLSPENRKQIQAGIEKNNTTIKSILTGKNGTAIKKILKDQGGSFGDEGDPKAQKMVRDTAGEVAQHQNLLQRVFGGFRGQQARGTMPVGGSASAAQAQPQVQPQAQPQPQGGFNSQANARGVTPNPQPQPGIAQPQQSVPQGQPQAPAGTPQTFNPGTQVQPQAAPQKVATAGDRDLQQFEKAMDNRSTYFYGTSQYQDAALKQYLELVKSGVVPTAKEAADVLHNKVADDEKHRHNVASEQAGMRTDILSEEKINATENIAKLAASTRLSVARIEANERYSQERLRGQNRIRALEVVARSKVPAQQAAALQGTITQLEKFLGPVGKEANGTLALEIKQKEGAIAEAMTKLPQAYNTGRMDAVGSKNPQTIADVKQVQDARAYITRLQKDVDDAKALRHTYEHKLVDARHQLLDLKAQGVDSSGGSTTINFNDSDSGTSSATQATGINDFDAAFAAINSIGAENNSQGTETAEQ